MNRLVVLLVAVATAAALFTSTATATSTPPSQPPPSTECSDWYLNPAYNRWEFSCLWGSWEDDFFVESYYWNAIEQRIQLFQYCGGSGWLPTFCCTVSPEGGMCDA